MTEPDGKHIYESSQKTRNLFIGFALGGFVILVFFVSISRMSQGVKKDAAHDLAPPAAMSSGAMSSGAISSQSNP